MKTAKSFSSPLRREKSRRDGTLLTVCFSLRTFSLRAILLLALAFFSCSNLHAQVTIGGTDIPKSGAILDLNSTAKGGLVLSNVPLINFDEIPASFPGANGANITALKAGLTGSVIYNTNPAFCTGVHLWNGQHWGRITAETPAPAPGTLSIITPLADMFGNDPVEFAAAPGAKIYRWYASKKDAPYEYLGATATSAFSKAFSSGEYRVKVIMDDCYSLKESNEVSFAPGAISPYFGSSGGGNYIYIYGDFPYAATGEYYQDGLVAHYDAINNTGEGDKFHNGNATEWKDLSGNNYDVKLRIGNSDYGNRYNATDAENVSQCSGAEWHNNGFLFNGYCYFAKVPADPSATNALSDIMPNLPFDNENYTIESVFDPSQLSGTSHGGFVSWGMRPFVGDNSTSNCTRFYGATNTDMRFRHYWYRNDIDVRFTDTGSNNIRNFAVTYDNSTEADPDNRTFYYNGTTNSIQYISTNCGSTTNDCREKTDKNTSRCGSFFIGQAVRVNTYDMCGDQTNNTTENEYANGNKIFSIRVYNNPLTSEQVAHNYEIDRLRFTAPPTVTIGGKLCTEVVVLSPHILKCKVPAGDGTGRKDVVINGGAIIYSDAYEYVDPANDFYISEISPIIGVAGATLTLRGNKLDGIIEVMAGGKICTNPSYDAFTDTYTCTLPDNPAGETNITITAGSKVYLFAKVFEYR